MDREEILEKSRKENQYKDPIELEAFNKANDAALTVGILVCVLLTALHRTILGGADFGVWTVDWAIMATIYAVRFIKLRKKSDMVLALLGLGLFAGFLWFYLHSTLGVL
jgi:asparagine N-glycosylation enzyme membrane subunit Stt3